MNRRGETGNIFAMLFAAVAMTGVVASVGMQTVMGPITTASKVTHQNMADTDLMTNARVVVMNAATLTDGGDIDADGYVEPAPYLPTGSTGCAITLPGAGGCLPADIGASLTDPWGTQYAYCVWDHGDPASSVNRIDGGDSTSEAVIALISAGPDKTFQTPCLAYDPGTPDQALIDPEGLGDDKVRTYTYDAAVAGAHGLWSLKEDTPDTAVIDKKLEVGTGLNAFSFDTGTGEGNFPSIRTDYIGSKSGTSVKMVDNIALDGQWLSGDGGDEGVFVAANGNVGIGTITSGPVARLHVMGKATSYPSSKVEMQSQSVLTLKPHQTDSINMSFASIGAGDTMGIQVTNSPGDANWNISLNPFGGNVGIGTVGPQYPLDVAGRSRAERIILADDIAPNGGVNVSMQRSDNTRQMLIGFSEAGAQKYTIGVNAGEDVLTFRGFGAGTKGYGFLNGNVGIGTYDPQQSLHTTGNIRADGRYVYFGENQHLYGDNDTALWWKSNRDGVTQMIFQDVDGTNYGRIYGSNDGLYFGLTDSTGAWTFLHAKDVYTNFRISNIPEMTLTPNYLEMYGNRIINIADPANAQDAATKSYVDNANVLGGLSCSSGQIAKWNGTGWACAADDAGGGGADNLGNHTATQDLDLGGHAVINVATPVNAQDAATKSYIDGLLDAIDTAISGLTSSLADKVSKAGDTMTGNLIAPLPTANNHVATKEYVDTVLAAGTGGEASPYCYQVQNAYNCANGWTQMPGYTYDGEFNCCWMASGDGADAFPVGYAVMTVSKYNGNLGGLAGANAKCLQQLQDHPWNGKADAQDRGLLTASNVEAYLCDSATCNNFEAYTRYYATRAGTLTGSPDYSETGASEARFLTKRISTQHFLVGSNIGNNNFWSGRDTDGSSTTSGNACQDWTYDSFGTYYGNYGAGTANSESETYSKSQYTCSAQNQLVCLVHPE